MGQGWLFLGDFFNGGSGRSIMNSSQMLLQSNSLGFMAKSDICSVVDALGPLENDLTGDYYVDYIMYVPCCTYTHTYAITSSRGTEVTTPDIWF